MEKTILIALAGLVGTLLRYWLSGFLARQYGETFPWGTMVVNLIGCLLAGIVFLLTEERFLVSPTVRTVILIGLADLQHSHPTVCRLLRSCGMANLSWRF